MNICKAKNAEWAGRAEFQNLQNFIIMGEKGYLTRFKRNDEGLLAKIPQEDVHVAQEKPGLTLDFIHKNPLEIV